MRKKQKVWRVPWTEVRYGTEYEKSDVDLNIRWATLMLDGLFVFAKELAATPDDKYLEQGVAVMDDVLVAFDVLGWKVVAKDDSSLRYPMLRQDDFRPDWCG